MPTVPTLTTLHRAEFPGDHYATVNESCSDRSRTLVANGSP